MKYTVEGYSQEKAIELGLNIEDLIILRWIQDFYPLMAKNIINDEEYVWISYSKLLEDLPILSFKNKRSLMRKLKNFAKIGLLKRECIRDKNGAYSYIIITNKINILLSSKDASSSIKNDMTPETHGYDARDTSHMTRETQQNNPSTINNPSTKIEKYIEEKLPKANKQDFKAYGEFANVLLTDEQYSKLKTFWSIYLSQGIETLSEYIASSGRKYKNYYAVLGKNNWVYKTVTDRLRKEGKIGGCY